MKKLILIFVIIPILGVSQDYQIAQWYNFKKGAVCLTFDDGTLDHRDNVIPALNANGIPGTFFLNQRNSYSWPKKAIIQGHEMGNHTLSHAHLSIIDKKLFKNEIFDFQITLQNELGDKVSTFAYPYGEGGELNSSVHYIQDSIAKSHIGARGVTQPIGDNAYKYDFYQDDRAYYQVNTVHMRNSMTSYDVTFNKVIEYGGLMTYMFHAVGNKNGWDNIDLDNFNAFLDSLSRRKSQIWISTFQDAIKYHRQRKRASLKTISEPFENGNNWVLNLTDSLNDMIYDHALTIKLAIPTQIKGILAVNQNNVSIPFKVLNDSVRFNAIPDKGDIVFDIIDCDQPIDSLSISGPRIFCSPDSLVIQAVYNKEYVYSLL